jgi:hypothetical protein
MRGGWNKLELLMPTFSNLHLEHTHHLFLSERSRRESKYDNLSKPVATISSTVHASSSLFVEVDIAPGPR